jgi:hypothetical protein
MQNLSVSFSIRNIFDGFNRSRKFLGEISRTKVKFPIQAEKNLEYFERDKWFREEATIKGLLPNRLTHPRYHELFLNLIQRRLLRVLVTPTGFATLAGLPLPLKIRVV